MNTRVTHRTTIVGKCPHGCQDIYQAEFHVDHRVITIESIQEAIDTTTEKPIYQEDLTQALANKVGCKVITKGSHGRFETTCVSDPE